MLTFESESAKAVVDPARGGRVASLNIRGTEVLVGPDPDPMRWGCYPMVPFAGRIRHGRFLFAGTQYQLPTNLRSHAIHGYGYTSEWQVVDDKTIGWDFTRPWPFPGRVTQAFEVDDVALTMTMRATAHERQPMMLGWHPWFVRDIGLGGAVSLAFGPAQMYELDPEELPTGRLVPTPAGPWDNCFTGLVRPPRLTWGSSLELGLSSSADHWVVFTEPDHAVCVEPQTGAPNDVNRAPTVLEAGQTLELTFRIAWSTSRNSHGETPAGKRPR